MLRDVAVGFFKESRVIGAQKLAKEMLEHDRAKKNKMKPSEVADSLSTKQGLQVSCRPRPHDHTPHATRHTPRTTHHAPRTTHHTPHTTTTHQLTNPLHNMHQLPYLGR